MYSFSPDKDKANNERGYDSRFIEGRQKVCLVRARCFLDLPCFPASAANPKASLLQWSDCLSSPDESPVHPAQKALAPVSMAFDQSGQNVAQPTEPILVPRRATMRAMQSRWMK